MVVGVTALWTFTRLLNVTDSTALVVGLSVPLAVSSGLVARLKLPAALRWAAWSCSGVMAGVSLSLVISEIVYRLR
jgi:hypothetical protein